jgi:hypothetical protein
MEAEFHKLAIEQCLLRRFRSNSGMKGGGIMPGKRTYVDFALDIYHKDENERPLVDRLIKEWNNAIRDPNPVQALYMLFRLEGYDDVTYEEVLKFWETYKAMRIEPPWKAAEEGGPVCY